jgi:hypothetical protein
MESCVMESLLVLVLRKRKPAGRLPLSAESPEMKVKIT